jgi:hypothetical protein
MQSSHDDRSPWADWFPDWVPGPIEPTTKRNNATPDHVQPARHSMHLSDASYGPYSTGSNVETVEIAHAEETTLPFPGEQVLYLERDQDRAVK